MYARTALRRHFETVRSVQPMVGQWCEEEEQLTFASLCPEYLTDGTRRGRFQSDLLVLHGCLG